ncbi:MAG: GAF and ANTAR domain-containing protein [Actinomycetota bacterium]|nr:GAF and ANTAR domain-containing protein [Actinomycetota bacterium]
MQYQFGEGPCVSAIWDQETSESDDLTQEGRWPKWAPRAVEVGAASLVSFRLFVEQDTLGALNLYAGRPRAFDEVDRETGVIFASHAAVALSGARRKERMDGAIVAAKAVGMLMGRRGITSEQAMDVLRRAALQTNSKLSEVAERIVSQRPTGLGERAGALTLPEQEERAGATGDKGAWSMESPSRRR